MLHLFRYLAAGMASVLFSISMGLNGAAATILIDFEGLQDLEGVLDFYNGGFGGSGSGPGSNLGVTFATNAVAVIDSDAGGIGNFGGEPSPDTIMAFLPGTSTIMNVAAGFDSGFSFFYSSPNLVGSVEVFDGLDGTGASLASLVLPTTPTDGAPDPTGTFSPLLPIGVAFAGTARSVSLGGDQGNIGFDNLTFGSVVPIGQVPEPTSLAIFACAGMGLVFSRRRRSKAYRE